MKRDILLSSKVLLVFSDIVVVIVSFGLAYYYRVHFDARPYYFHPETMSFLWLSIMLIPLWVGVNFLSGLYDRTVFLYRSKEYGQVLMASVVKGPPQVEAARQRSAAHLNRPRRPAPQPFVLKGPSDAAPLFFSDPNALILPCCPPD